MIWNEKKFLSAYRKESLEVLFVENADKLNARGRVRKNVCLNLLLDIILLIISSCTDVTMISEKSGGRINDSTRVRLNQEISDRLVVIRGQNSAISAMSGICPNIYILFYLKINI